MMKILNAKLLQENTNIVMRLLPRYFNARARRLCNNILKERNKDEIYEAWKKRGIALADHTKFRVPICSELRWCNDLFHPDDECYVVFDHWEIRSNANLSLVYLFTNINKIFKCDVRDIPEDILTDTKLTLCQFLEAVVNLRKKSRT